MSIGLGVTTFTHSASNADLNDSENTVLHTVVALKPIQIQRYGVVSEASQGLLSPMRLKLRRVTGGGATAADIAGTTLNPGGARARGVMVYKEPESRVVINAGEHVTVAISTAAGGTSTGRVWIEYQELPFSGTNVPDSAVKSE